MKKILILAIFSLIMVSVKAQIKVNSNGYVGIITTTPAYRLDINSPESRSYYSTKEPFTINHWGSDPRLCSTSQIVFYKSNSSGYINIQCGTLYEYSDSTAKENINTLEKGNIDKVEKLRGVNFNWKSDKGKNMQAGFLAQEVEQVIPEAVITNDSTKHKSLSYSAIIPYLVEAIKEQQAEIEELKKQISK